MPKFASLDELYTSLQEDQRVHITSLVAYVQKHFPQLDLVLAWNQPMFKSGKEYVIGFMPTKNHTNLLTVTDTAITELAPVLAQYRHGTRSISLPFDWVIDDSFFQMVIEARARELNLTW